MMRSKRRKTRMSGATIFFLASLCVLAGAALIYIALSSSSYSDEMLDTRSAEQIIQSYADENGIDRNEYPQRLVELLEKNKETKDFVLSYPAEHSQRHTVDLSEYKNSETVPLFMQWDKRWGYINYGGDMAGLTGCGPLCLSMAAFYLTNDSDMSPDKIIEFAKENGYALNGITQKGSSWTLISEGGEKLGLDVTEIPLDENRIIKNLEAGNPIICSMGAGDFTSTGHFIVLTEYSNGKIRINDPNSYKNSEKLWEYDSIKDQIRNLWVIRNK